MQWPASSIPCCGCKYSWEEDLATVPSSPPHIAFPEVKCQTSLKYHPGLQPTRASGGGQPGSPPGFCPDLWRCAAQRHKSGHTSDNVMGGWRAFCQSRDTNMGRVGTGTAPGRTACFSFSIKDSKKKKQPVPPWWLCGKLCLSSAVEAPATSWEIPAASPCCSSLSEEEGWLTDHGQVLWSW